MSTLSEKTQDRSCNVQGCTAVLVKLWEQSCQEASRSNTGSLNSNLAMWREVSGSDESHSWTRTSVQPWIVQDSSSRINPPPTPPSPVLVAWAFRNDHTTQTLVIVTTLNGANLMEEIRSLTPLAIKWGVDQNFCNEIVKIKIFLTLSWERPPAAGSTVSWLAGSPASGGCWTWPSLRTLSSLSDILHKSYITISVVFLSLSW